MSEQRATRRLFFALWPDETCRMALAHAARKATRSSGGRPVAVANLHSTLAFLGAVPAERLQVLAEAAGQVREPGFRLNLDRLEHWPKQGVLCIASSEPPAAAVHLAAALWKVLAPQGFVPEVRPYRPHVTIARKVVKPHGIGAIRPVEWSVIEFALVESVTAPEGAQYTPLQQWPLRGR